MTTYKLGRVTVDHTERQTTTILPNELKVFASHEHSEGQEKTAADYQLTVADMNRTHDLTHSLLAHWLGLAASPTLQGVATGEHYANWWIEERAVLAIQSFADAMGVDLVDVAKRNQR